MISKNKATQQFFFKHAMISEQVHVAIDLQTPRDKVVGGRGVEITSSNQKNS